MSAITRCQESANHRLGLRCALAVCAVLTLTGAGICSCDADSSHPCIGALDLCHSACSSGEVGACAALGQAYYRGSGVEQSFSFAARYYDEACALGSSDSCFRLGRMYETGHGICQDAAAAVERYGMACVYSGGRGCYETGRVFGRCIGTAKEAALARLYYRIACTKGDPRGCDALKHPLGERRLRHESRPRPDPVRPGSLD